MNLLPGQGLGKGSSSLLAFGLWDLRRVPIVIRNVISDVYLSMRKATISMRLGFVSTFFKLRRL
jgi:hypothetical protein